MYIKQEDGNLYEHFQEVHEEQTFPIEMYEAALEMVGFTNIKVKADFGQSEVQETSPTLVLPSGEMRLAYEGMWSNCRINHFIKAMLICQNKHAKKTGADVIVVVMSGNWVQRGEPAIEQKWSRAKVALQNGADVVIEMPTAVSCQATDRFAKGAVEILQKVGCEFFSIWLRKWRWDIFRRSCISAKSIEKKLVVLQKRTVH